MHSPEPAKNGAPASGTEFDDAFYQTALRELVGHGLELARGLVKQAAAHQAAPPNPAGISPNTSLTHRIVLSHDRVARSIRRTTALARDLARPKPPRHGPTPAPRALTPARPTASPPAQDAERPENPDRPERCERPQRPERPDPPDWNEAPIAARLCQPGVTPDIDASPAISGRHHRPDPAPTSAPPPRKPPAPD